MFASFDSVNTPGVKLWNFSRALSGSRAALEDDCAPFQYFITGSTDVYVSLPLNAAPGKMITLRNDKIGTASSNTSLLIADPTTTSGFIYTIGIGQVLTFVSVPNAVRLNPATDKQSQWIPLQVTPNLAGVSGAAVLSGTTSHVSGASAVICGGDSNYATANYAVVAGGQSNTASGLSAGVGSGSGNASSNTGAFVGGGETNLASGVDSVISGGVGNAANATASTIPGGSYATTRAIQGMYALGAHNAPFGSSAKGISQTGSLIIGVQTTDATATVLRSNVNAVGTTNQLVLPNNAAYHVSGTLIANVTGGGNTSAWKFDAVIKRGATAASTALVAAVTPTLIAQDAGASSWTVAVTADTTNGALAVTVTGAAATTIRWVCKLETTEVTY